ncbi:MAG: DUF3784 domain-containing protein [Halothermotrichaceae bacterium]
MINLFVPILFLLIGILIKYFKMYWLIAGYNTASTEEKENEDEEGLGNLIGNFSFIIAGVFLAVELLRYLGLTVPVFMPYLILVIGIIIVLIKAQRYNKQEEKTDKKFLKYFKKEHIIGVVVIILIIAVLGYIFLPAKVVFKEDYFQVKGLYGLKISMDNITEVQLKETIPPILMRTNGMDGFGRSSRGFYKLEELGKGKLFLQNTGKGPYLLIKYIDSKSDNSDDSIADDNNNLELADKRYLIINYNDSDRTNKLYQRLRAEI